MTRSVSRHDRPKTTTLSLTVSGKTLLEQPSTEAGVDQTIRHLVNGTTEIVIDQPVLVHPTPKPTHCIHSHIDLHASLR